MNIAYINRAKCKNIVAISAFNPSFLYGINCFEGIRAYWATDRGKLEYLDIDQHVDRLYASADKMGLRIPLARGQLIDEVQVIADHEGIEQDVYIRITFFLGDGGSWHDTHSCSYMISMRSLPSELGARPPAALGISKYRRISSAAMPPSVKAGANYLNSRYALLDVRGRGFDDALFVNADGWVSEATGSNIFFIKGTTVSTPALECDLLHGVTRMRVMALCSQHGIAVEEVKRTPGMLADYEAAFLTGTMVEMKPVSRIEEVQFDTAHPVFLELVKLLQRFIYGR